MQAMLSYDKPKGLSAVLLPLLCPPTDLIDLQRLLKLAVRLVVALSYLVSVLAFALVPAWLWLVRHEHIIGHNADAVAAAAGGLLLFLAAAAVAGAAERADANRRQGVFTAAARSAYQVAPGRYGGPNSSAASFGAAAEQHVAAAAAPRGGAAAATTASRSGPAAAAAANGTTSNGSAADPLVRQIKQRIIKLEQVLFGNELSEGDISRETLHARVRALCTDVGVPCGGPGSSSARASPAELNQQLQAVEKALGVS